MKKTMYTAVLAIASTLLIGAATVAAAPITHLPGDNPGVPLSPAFGAIAAGGELEDNYIDFGVDYTFGEVEAKFLDTGGVQAFGGTSGGNVDLLNPIDGRIVLAGTTTQGVTSFLSVVVGNTNGPGALLLEVFDSSLNLIASALNDNAGVGLDTVTIDRAGLFDIAYFRISKTADDSDFWGLRSVTIEAPVATPVPEPGTMLLFGAGLALVGLGRRYKRNGAASND